MPTISNTQIAQYAYNAGFRNTALITAVAIALAESGGNSDIYNPETAAGTPLNNGSRGLWQIYGNAHPQYNNNSLYDPQTNANAAYAVANNGVNFSPWTTWGNGSGPYSQYIQQARDAIASTSGTVTTNLLGASNSDPCAALINNPALYLECQIQQKIKGPIDTLSAVSSLASWTTDPIRIIKIATGVGLLFVALLLLLQPEATKATQEAIKAAPLVATA